VTIEGGDPAAAGQIDDLPLPFCPSEYQGQRLSKIRLNRASPIWTISGVCNAGGFRSFGEVVVRIVHAELGIDQTFEVVSFGMHLNDFTYPITLRALADDAYAMAEDELQDMPPAPHRPTTGDTPMVLTPPAGVTALRIAQSPDTVVVTWPDAGFDVDLQIRLINPANGAEDNWTTITVTTPGTATAANLAHGNYEIRIRTRTFRGMSDWTAPIAAGDAP